MNPFADPKKMEELFQAYLKNPNKPKSVELTDAENEECQKHAWGD